MTTEQLLSGEHLPDSIKNGVFLLVGSGETYFTEIVKGVSLLRRIMIATSGDNPEDWNTEELEGWHNQLSDRDNWNNDTDLGPTTFEQSIGETDCLELFRITDGRAPELPVIMGKQITRDEVMAVLWISYKDSVALAKRKDRSTVGFPDMEAVLNHIGEHGLPPKGI